MTDVLTPEQRRRNMQRVGGKNTKPEMLLRRGLHALGFRYRLHAGDLPGRPDLVFPRYSAIILVNGCFWHGHNCTLFKWPNTRKEFWQGKIEGNRARDARTLDALRSGGWRVLTVWECALRGATCLSPEEVLDRCEAFLVRGTCASDYLAGVQSRPGKLLIKRRSRNI